MSIATGPTTYTPEDLLAMPDGDRFELVDGQLVERNMSGLSSLVATTINRRIGTFAESKKLGLVFQSDCGYQCFPDAPDKVRRPDGSFVRAGRLSLDQLERGHLRIAPDLAVEVVSPNDTAYETDMKVEEFLRTGVRLVWVINPQTRVVLVFRLDGTVGRLHEHDDVSGEGVLPGFSCRVGELFDANI